MPGTAPSFADMIAAAVDDGYGFVPLLGAGISAASGIPPGQQLRAVLFPYLCQAISRKWSPADGSWPPSLPQVPWPNGYKTWFRKRLAEWAGWANKGAKGPTLDYLLESIGAYADWRFMLHFLSRIRWDGKPGNEELRAGAPDQAVIDMAFAHLTAGKHPNLGHLMLAHLADGLRVRTILTTNFDDLVERSFATLHTGLERFDVHVNASLPGSQIVRSTRSVVKLHGGRYGLRADMTLDILPAPAEQNAFAGYFAADPRQATGPAAKHALVMGVSGQDRRTMALLAQAMTKVTNMKVFWACHDPDACRPKDGAPNEIVKRLRDAQRELGCVIKTSNVHVAHVPDLSLFLFGLYQRRHYALPPAGVAYSAIARVAPYAPGTPAPDGLVQMESPTNEQRAKQRKQLVDWVKKRTWTPTGRVAHPLKAVSAGAGLTIVASEVFRDRDLQKDYECVWLDLAQYRRTQDFRVGLLEVLADRLGKRHDLGQPPGTVRDESFGVYMRELIAPPLKPFLVFVNGREPIGSCAGWFAPGLNQPPRDKDRKFWDCIRELAAGANESVQAWVRFVVLYRNRGDAALVAETGDGVPLGPPQGTDWERLDIKEGCLTETTAQIVHRALEWIQDGDTPRDGDTLEVGDTAQRARFVGSLTLFRRSRHAAALSSWALLRAPNAGHRPGTKGDPSLDNDQKRAEMGNLWLKALEQRSVVRRKDGGFVWMYQDVRRDLRKALEQEWPGVIAYERPFCHQGIADWYAKLFRSSEDPLAALESLYHRLCAYKWAAARRWKAQGGDLPRPSFLLSTLQEANDIVYQARDAILARGHLDCAEELPKAIGDLLRRHRATGAVRALGRQLCQRSWQLLADLYRRKADYDQALRAVDAWGKLRQDSTLGDLEQRYAKARCLTGLRSYEKAEKEFQCVLAKLGLKLRSNASTRAPDWVASLRRRAAAWVLPQGRQFRSQPQIQLAIRVLVRYLFLRLLRAQAQRLRFSGTGGRRDGAAKSHKMFRSAEGMYVIVTTLLRFVNEPDFVTRQNVHVRTLYGVMLANIQCPYEAHRRLSEAAAYLARWPNHTTSVAWAVIDLRRAETYLRQSEAALPALIQAWPVTQCDADVDASRRALAFVEDADAALDRAHHRLLGNREYVWWWTLLYELQMTVCLYRRRLLRAPDAIQDGGCGACRRCAGGDDLPRYLIKHGQRLVWQDVARFARLIELYAALQVSRHPLAGPDVVAELRRLLAELTTMYHLRRGFRELTGKKSRRPLDPNLKAYVQQVIRLNPILL